MRDNRLCGVQCSSYKYTKNRRYKHFYFGRFWIHPKYTCGSGGRQRGTIPFRQTTARGKTAYAICRGMRGMKDWQSTTGDIIIVFAIRYFYFCILTNKQIFKLWHNQLQLQFLVLSVGSPSLSPAVIQMDHLLTRGYAAIAENSYSSSIAMTLSDSV